VTGEYGVCDDYWGERREGGEREGEEGDKKNLELYLCYWNDLPRHEEADSLIPRPHTKNWGPGNES